MSLNLTVSKSMQRKTKLLFLSFICMFASCTPIHNGEYTGKTTLTVSQSSSSSMSTAIPAEPEEIIPTTTAIPTRIPTQIVSTEEPEPIGSPENTKTFLLDQVKPETGDGNQQHGKVFVDSVEIQFSETWPKIRIAGFLPTPCHNLRANMQIQEIELQVQVELYSLADSGLSCIQTLEPFTLEFPVELKTEGTYKILINQVEMDQFDWPVKS